MRISPNSRAIFRQDSPASSLTYTSPKRLHATSRLAVRRMRRQAPDGGVGADGQGQGSPRLPAVARAEHGARLPGRGLAAPGEDHAGIVGLHRDAARVRQRPLRLHPDRRPRLAAIGAQNTSPFVLTSTRGGWSARCHVVHVEIAEPADDGSRCRRRPGCGRLRRSRRRPRSCAVVGVDEHAGHERRADRALRRHADVEPLPVPSAVARAIDRRRRVPAKSVCGIGGIDGQRPDRRQVPRRADPRPGRAAVVAAEEAGVAGGQETAGLARERRPAPGSGCSAGTGAR